MYTYRKLKNKNSYDGITDPLMQKVQVQLKETIMGVHIS